MPYLRNSAGKVRIPRALIGLALPLAIWFIGQGCGYTTRSTLPDTYRRIYVPPARNSIREYDLQAPLTNALRRKFTVDGRLRVVDAGKADLRLDTEIKGYRLDPLTYGEKDRVTQFRVTVVAAATLKDTRTDEQLWREENVHATNTFMMSGLAPAIDPRGTTGFFASTVRSFPSGNEGEAATEALDDLASQILYLTVEHW